MIGIILYLVASALFFPIAVLNLVVSIYKKIKNPNRAFFATARGIDIFANEAFPILWNTLLRKSGSYTFGHKGETLSSTLGKLQLNGGLSKIGWVVVYILWFIDYKYWKKGGHCLNSIDI